MKIGIIAGLLVLSAVLAMVLLSKPSRDSSATVPDVPGQNESTTAAALPDESLDFSTTIDRPVSSRRDGARQESMPTRPGVKPPIPTGYPASVPGGGEAAAVPAQADPSAGLPTDAPERAPSSNLSADISDGLATPPGFASGIPGAIPSGFSPSEANATTASGGASGELGSSRPSASSAGSSESAGSSNLPQSPRTSPPGNSSGAAALPKGDAAMAEIFTAMTTYSEAGAGRLTQFLASDEIEVRRATAEALKQIRAPSSAEALRSAAEKVRSEEEKEYLLQAAEFVELPSYTPRPFRTID